jgi:hypothetical protein
MAPVAVLRSKRGATVVTEMIGDFSQGFAN